MNQRPDRFTRACLIAIILLLAIIAGQEFSRLESVRAQSNQSYKTEIIDDGPDSASRVDKVVFRQHDVRFETAVLVFDDPYAITQRDVTFEDEERWITVGAIGPGSILLVVHTF